VQYLHPPAFKLLSIPVLLSGTGTLYCTYTHSLPSSGKPVPALTCCAYSLQAGGRYARKRRDETAKTSFPSRPLRRLAHPLIHEYLFMYDAYPAHAVRTVHLEIREAIQYHDCYYRRADPSISRQLGLHRTSARSNHRAQPRRHGPACPPRNLRARLLGSC
jgi:hypothetical protein